MDTACTDQSASGLPYHQDHHAGTNMSSLYYQGFLKVPVLLLWGKKNVLIPSDWGYMAGHGDENRRAPHWNITFLGFISTESPLLCPLSPSSSPSAALHLPVRSQGWRHQVKLRQDGISRCEWSGEGDLRDRSPRRAGSDHQVHGRPCQWVRGQGLLPGGAGLSCARANQNIYCFLIQ